MDLKLRLQRVLQIVEEAERIGVMSDLERDIVLGELREVYSAVKFGFSTVAEPMGRIEPTEADAVVDASVENAMAAAAAVPLFEDEEEGVAAPVDLANLFEAVGLTNHLRPTSEPIVEESAEVEPTTEPIVEESVAVVEESVVAEPIVEESVVVEESAVVEPAVAESAAVESAVVEAPNAPTQTAAYPFPPKRSPLLSLYEEDAPVLGEQFHETPSVADAISCPKGVAESTPVASLREAIGVADRYMLIRELFDGDAEAYDVAITNLDRQTSFDDCVIYISENYVWRAQSEATKTIMSLLKRKFNE